MSCGGRAEQGVVTLPDVDIYGGIVVSRHQTQARPDRTCRTAQTMGGTSCILTRLQVDGGRQDLICHDWEGDDQDEGDHNHFFKLRLTLPCRISVVRADHAEPNSLVTTPLDLMLVV